MQDASVSLDVLLALGSHPLVCVGREASFAADLVLTSGVYDALARLSEQVLKVQTVADVLLRDLVSKAHVGLNEVVRRLLDLDLGALRVLDDGHASNLLGLVEDDSGCGEGREKCGHVVCLQGVVEFTPYIYCRMRANFGVLGTFFVLLMVSRGCEVCCPRQSRRTPEITQFLQTSRYFLRSFAYSV